ncbi:hypothetical protein ACNKHT_26950 [Shigella flexneri]
MYWLETHHSWRDDGRLAGLITAVVLMIPARPFGYRSLVTKKPSSRINTRRCLDQRGIPRHLVLLATDNSAEGARERELFREQLIRSQNGFGVEQGRGTLISPPSPVAYWQILFLSSMHHLFP